MTDLLKRSLAPITDEAWKEIDAQAARILKGNLSARGLVDFSGPHGWNAAAVNTGHVKWTNAEKGKGTLWGIREALPLVEVRVPFTLKLSELDEVPRGAKNPDLAALITAARKMASFEEKALYHGMPEAGIQGLAEVSTHKPIELTKDVNRFAEAVEAAVLAIEKSGIGGPYALVLGTEPYRMLMVGDPATYPARKRVEPITGGPAWSPALSGGVVLSKRGGDFELTVGQDIAIGYAGHDRETADLYFTESFTFRVLEPAAAVELKLKA